MALPMAPAQAASHCLEANVMVAASARLDALSPSRLPLQRPRRGVTGKPKGRHCARESHRTAPLSWRKPTFDPAQLDIIRGMLAQDASPTAIAEAAGVSRQAAYRVRGDPAMAEAMLAE
jgi:hypothetical protein